MGRRWTIGRFLSGAEEEPERAGVQNEPRPAQAKTTGPSDASDAAGTRALWAAADALGKVLEESECEIGCLASEFEAMAQATQTMVESAAAVVGCTENERVRGVLVAVQGLSTAARSFLHQRLDSTAGIVQAVTAEAALLARLAQLTLAQKAIVRETAMLRVLTNIEVARLGEAGAGFEYLARELDDFATSVAESIGALTAHTEERRTEIDAMRRALTAERPRLQEEYTQREEALVRAQSEMDRTLAEIEEIPARFQGCVEEIARQVAGVVAAIQAHDITRQQMEHVRSALIEIAGEMENGGVAAEVAAGLTIQSYQLRSIRATVEGWTGQIHRCLEGIAQLAATEMLELGRSLLGRERGIEAELVRIQQLEEQCAADNAKVQGSLAGIAGLMELVSEHLERSRAVRERLQLLMFNSIVEASHLGAQADGILEISNTIKRLSRDWSAITQQSEEAMQEIRVLVEETRTTTEAFSGEAQEGLRGAREQTGAGLLILRETAGCAESRGRQIQEEAGALQGRVAEVRGAGERLERCLAQLGGVFAEVDAVPGAPGSVRTDGTTARWDASAMERRFGSIYTTEMERAVLRAALGGGPLPAAQASLAGNGVELF
ncbi:MAG: hypothetical protein WBW84_08375 [Acidobacteriaceae bacterium]